MLKDFNILTLIVTNYTKYLDQCVNSAFRPYVVFDGIDTIKGEYHYSKCNANRPSIARNLDLKNFDCEFIQLLDSDDFLGEKYYNRIQRVISQNNDYDLFYTDYTILNEDFSFNNREYLKSPSNTTIRDVAPRVKNPIIRTSTLKKIRFDESLSCFELVDLIYKIGPSKLYHYPYDMQTVRIHPKCFARTISKTQRDESMNIISRRINGKV